MKALRAGAIMLLVSLSGCATTAVLRCPGAQKPEVADTLFFGLATPNAVVTDEQWSRFLASTVTPRFPQGLSVWDAAGQWLGAKGVLVHERTHVLYLIHDNDGRTEVLVTQIIAAYKTQFAQESVLRVRADVCASF